MDGVRLLAARCRMRAAGRIVATCPPRVAVSNGGGGDPVRPQVKGHQPESVWKTTARGDLSRRNGNKNKAPGEARPPRSLPDRLSASGAESCPIASPAPLRGRAQTSPFSRHGRPFTGTR